MADEPDELPSPGWRAIEDAMMRLYGDAQPSHVGQNPMTIPSSRDGGSNSRCVSRALLPGAPATALTVYAVTLDPELGEVRTPNGRLAFLQLVGVTAAEKARMVATKTPDVLAELARTDPLLINDPFRAA